MTYRDSLKHLIAEQQRQRLNIRQDQLIQQTLKEHTSQITTINNQLVARLKRELNRPRVIQFLKKL